MQSIMDARGKLLNLDVLSKQISQIISHLLSAIKFQLKSFQKNKPSYHSKKKKNLLDWFLTLLLLKEMEKKTTHTSKTPHYILTNAHYWSRTLYSSKHVSISEKKKRELKGTPDLPLGIYQKGVKTSSKAYTEWKTNIKIVETRSWLLLVEPAFPWDIPVPVSSHGRWLCIGIRVSVPEQFVQAELIDNFFFKKRR